MRAIVAVILLVLPTLIVAAPANTGSLLNCVIFPDQEVELGSPVPGVIEHIGVRRSDRVTKGQAIARLESSVEQATVALARARAATDTEIELRRVEFGYDAQHRDRLQALQVRQAVSSQNLEDAERVAEAARLRVRLAQDKRREAALDQRRADAMLARKTIVSPIDGVVVQLNNQVGEYVETRPVARIARLDPLRVEVIVPLALFGSVKEGMKVAVGPETDPGHERLAIVSAVDAVADPGSGTFGVQLQLSNPGLELPAGIKCTARLLSPDEARVAEMRSTEQGASESAVVAAPLHTNLGDASNTETTLVRASAPKDNVPAVCLAFDAHESEQQARNAAGVAERLGGQVELKEVDESRVFGYLVATPTALSPEHQRAVAERFRNAGISDLAIIDRGAYAGRIALGTYNGPRGAERRRAALANLNIVSEVLPRTRTQRSWRVEIRFPKPMEADGVLAELRHAVGDGVTRAGGCEPLLTASR